MLFPITSCSISNLFLKEFMLMCANINLFGFLSLISCKSLKLCVKELGLPKLPLSSTSELDLSLFDRNHNQKKFSYKNFVILQNICQQLLLEYALKAEIAACRKFRAYLMSRKIARLTRHFLQVTFSFSFVGDFK